MYMQTIAVCVGIDHKVEAGWYMKQVLIHCNTKSCKQSGRGCASQCVLPLMLLQIKVIHTGKHLLSGAKLNGPISLMMCQKEY